MEIWPIISLTIFFVFFICLVLWVIKADQGYINKMKQLPVEDEGKGLSTLKNEKS
ncbi:hypothetical protein C900_03365 [Fulvivirga imtechensis AK7]|uniref:Uncharacterized protein n=1 Tax=Fulvivirga imtechensis AK7 TaxID=1237149 RepID=L8JTZ5_9BACT|nr:hypothetical protein C900_03365 [Fulvivirga imtechensis AK7]